MRVIDLETWPRREHFLLFCKMEFPNVNLSIHVDVTDLWKKRSQVGASPTILIAYALARAANAVPEFRQRIRDDQVIEHDVIHPQIAVLGPDNLFGVCELRYDPDFLKFAENANRCIEASKRSTSLDTFPHIEGSRQQRDDLLSITALPWLSTTGFGITRPKADSIPLLAYGRVKEECDRYLLPIHLNFHHALIDGLHIARFAKRIEEAARDLVAKAARATSTQKQSGCTG